MATFTFSHHLENVMKTVGEDDTVIITNYTDSGNTDNRGQTKWNSSTVQVDKAVVQIEDPTLNRKEHGVENLHDAVVFVPNGTTVYEDDSSHQASNVNARGKDYIVEDIDEQQGMIKLGCRTKR